MDYQIDTEVFLTNGLSISRGMVVSFSPHTDAITGSGIIPTDLSWHTSKEAQENKYMSVIACKDSKDRIKTQMPNVYLQSDVTVNKLSYDIIQNYGLVWLESIYGKGNVQILN